jgi:integrase
MPLKLIPPRAGKTPYWSIRGTYLGRYVDRSTKARQRGLAAKVLRQFEQAIERGELAEPQEATFASAAIDYMNAGGERTFLTRLIEHFGTTLLRNIDQAAIDRAAVELYPNASAATRNRQVYTPVSAILRHSGAGFQLRRPRGAQGQQRTRWLWPEEAERLFDAAGAIDREFKILLVLLTYTGIRLSEALALECRQLRLKEAFAYLPTSKNEQPRAIFLPPHVVAEVAGHPRGVDRDGRLFRFRKSGRLYLLWQVATIQAELDLPERAAFHVLSHTWATWMRRYAGLDTKGLVATGRWKDRKSADRYEHVVVSEEARRAALLPWKISGNAG